jgi:thioesterase domain-containing protein/acyl carrier protein
MVLAHDQRQQTSVGHKVQTQPPRLPLSRPKRTVEDIVPPVVEDAHQPVFREIMRIISAETGIAEDEIADDCEFVGMGIDSLMALSMAGKIREELGVAINSSTLTEFSTIRDLRHFLERTADPETTQGRDSQDIVSVTTAAAQSTIPSRKNIAAEDLDKKALQVISEETGVPVSELAEDAELSSLGVDSLLSLILVSRLNEEFNLNITGDAASFSGISTVAGLKAYICEQVAPSALAPATFAQVATLRTTSTSRHAASSSISMSSEELASFKGTSVTSFGSDRDLRSPTAYPSQTEMQTASRPVRATSSVILQGRPKQSEKSLFLFPDGSGSAASYSKLPAISPTIATIALNSPYYANPDGMTCDLDELIDSYLAEIRRRQPFGPYNLSGWSSRGILAYRAAQRLIQMGEHVESLLLIDSPSPVNGLDRLPQRLYDQLFNSGMFGQTNKTKQHRLDAHFRGTIEILHDYLADPLPEGFAPKVSIIWAGDCVFDGVSLPRFDSKPEDPEGIKFLTEKRIDMSAGEWQMLFPGVDIDVHVMKGANHFSMMVSWHMSFEILRMLMMIFQKEHVPNLTTILWESLR